MEITTKVLTRATYDHILAAADGVASMILQGDVRMRQEAREDTIMGMLKALPDRRVAIGGPGMYAVFRHTLILGSRPWSYNIDAVDFQPMDRLTEKTCMCGAKRVCGRKDLLAVIVG